MNDHRHFNRQARRTAALTLALVGFIPFGVLVLADGDWIPGGIIVAAALAGLATQVPLIRRLCRHGAASCAPPPKTGHQSHQRRARHQS